MLNFQLVCDTDIRGGCRGTRTTRGWRGYRVSNIILGLLETVVFKGILRFEVWIDIQGRGRIHMVFLKVSGEDLEWSGNHKQIFVVG